MVEIVALASGALAAGLAVYRYYAQHVTAEQPASATMQAPRTKPILRQERSRRVPSPNTAAAPMANAANPSQYTDHTKEALSRGFCSSSLSLGIASTGLILLPPLQYATVPVLIYMGAPAARRAYDLLRDERRVSRAFAETTVLAICLGGGWYLVGSLGFWLYYLTQLTNHKRTLAQQQRSVYRTLPQSAQRIEESVEVTVPTATLQTGDVILVATGDIVPVNGVIANGMAWVQTAAGIECSSYHLKRTGDQLKAADIVIAGRVALRVQKAT